jgi:hypothetical protein
LKVQGAWIWGLWTGLQFRGYVSGFRVECSVFSAVDFGFIIQLVGFRF